MNPYAILLNYHKYFFPINPFEYCYQINKWWAETLFEVNSLRNCRNIDVGRINQIEKALRFEGIL